MTRAARGTEASTNDAEAIETFLSDLLALEVSAAFAVRLELLREARARFEGLPEDAQRDGLARVAKRRLLASNSLRGSSGEEAAKARAHWDRANAVAASFLAPSPSAPSPGALGPVAMASQLNAVLRGLDAEGSAQTPVRAPVRTEPLHTTNETYLAPHRLAHWLGRLDETLKASSSRGVPTEAGEGMPHAALVRAFQAYTGIVTLHPFEDANGRTARLLADVFLLGAGWLPLCFLSPVQSHVAATVGGRRRDITGALDTFAQGVANAYEAALAPVASGGIRTP